MPITVGFVINIEPHYHEATFDGDYRDITAKDILDVAPKVCMDFYREQTSGLPPPKEIARRENYRLHHIVEEATAFNLHRAYEASYDIRPAQRFNTNVLKQALGWYRATGHYLISEHVGSTSKLASKASPPNTTLVRWYVVVTGNKNLLHPLACIAPRPLFIALVAPTEQHPLILKESCLVRRRNAYLDTMVEILAQNESCTSILLSEDQESKAPTLYDLALVQSKLPISEICRPELFEPAFAYAYTMDSHRKQVVVEEQTWQERDKFDTDVCLCRIADAGWGREYKTEGERSRAIFRTLGGLFDDPRADKNHFTGECITAHGLPALYVIGEDDAIPRDAGWPHERSMLAYQRKIASNRYKAVREMTCCPCLVVSLEQMVLTVWMAYLKDSVHGSELCRIRLKRYVKCVDPETCRMVIVKPMDRQSTVVSLQILRNTARMLRDSYAKVHTGSILPHTPHLFPRPASIINILPSVTPASIASLASLNLTITDQVPVSMHPIPTLGGHRWGHFRGAIQNPADGAYSPVYIKFTGWGYGEAAHRLLARHDPPLAPQLLYCNEVLYGFKMIVMEDLQGDTLDALSAPVSDDVATAIDRDIVPAVSLLHTNNLVHGDVRASHVVVQRSTTRDREDGTTRAFLLKFNWALKEGEARYPTFDMTDDDNVEWVAPVEDLRQRHIEKAHDVSMLWKLRDSYVGRSSLVRDRTEDSTYSDECEGSEAENEDRRLAKRPRLSPDGTSSLTGTSMEVDD